MGNGNGNSLFKGKKGKRKKAEMNSLIFDNEMKINWIIDIHLDDNQAVFALASIGIMLIDINRNGSEWKYFGRTMAATIH